MSIGINVIVSNNDRRGINSQITQDYRDCDNPIIAQSAFSGECRLGALLFRNRRRCQIQKRDELKRAFPNAPTCLCLDHLVFIGAVGNVDTPVWQQMSGMHIRSHAGKREYDQC